MLLDRKSLIVAYDVRRGEPRGKVHKSLNIVDAPTEAKKQGDCVDCGACVRTCPTGIDIRKGLQMECINCTQCIDACDEIMTRLERPTGLIRYSSQDGIDGKSLSKWRPRLVIYPLALTLMISAFLYVLTQRLNFDATMLRNIGSPFTLADGGEVRNSMKLKLVNRADRPLQLDLRLVGDERVRLESSVRTITLAPDQTIVQPLLVLAPRDSFENGRRDVKLIVAEDGGKERSLSWRLLGPMGK